MKKILLLALAGLLLLGVGVLATRHYDQYKINKQNEQAKTEDQLTQKLEEEQAKNAELSRLFNDVRVQCEVGSISYNYLTPALKRQAGAQPHCPPANTVPQ